ncbi:MAG: hypothetical protein ABR511_02840 [Acidimicrobiales bacterium]
MTCSERCGRLWPLARYHLDDEYRARHRVSVARWALAHPDSCPPERVRSAERSLAGSATVRGRWTVAGSHVERALDEARFLRVAVARRWGLPSGDVGGDRSGAGGSDPTGADPTGADPTGADPTAADPAVPGRMRASPMAAPARALPG